MKNFRGVLVLIVSLLFLRSVPTFAQAGFASLSGKVTDPSGLAVVGANLEVVNQDTNVSYPAETNESGLYSLPSLRPGTYRISVTKEGFQAIARPNVELHVADTVSIDFKLQVGAVAQTVTVEGGAPLVNTTGSSLGGLVQSQEVASLPLNGRNYINLTLMQPGVTADVNEQKSGVYAGVYFSSNGAPTRSNNFMIDGAIMQDQNNGSTADYANRTLGIDGIEEYRVITNSYGAEYGLVMGSQTVMVSKSGTNQFHGSAFEYLRNDVLDAANFFDAPTVANGEKRLPPYKRNNFGAAFGGPIRKDKTFFFATFEGVRERLGVTNVNNVPAAACQGPAGAVVWNGVGTQPAGSIGPCSQLGNNPADKTLPYTVTIASSTAPILALYPLPNLANNQETSPYSQPDNDNFGQIRLDHTFSSKDSLFGRYTILNDTIVAPVLFSQYFTNPKYARHQFLTLSENHIFSTSMLNSFRISYSRTTAIRSGTDPLTSPQYTFVNSAYPGIGQLTVGGLSLFGPSPSPSITAIQNLVTLSDDITWVHGAHSLKFGTLLNKYRTYATNTTGSQGSVQFTTLASFMSGIASSYSGIVAGSLLDRTNLYYTIGFYAQDEWRLRKNFTLNYGLRYEPAPDYGHEAHGISSDLRNLLTDTSTTVGPLFAHNPTWHNFSPRLGFAWDVFGNGKTAVRAGAAELYDVSNAETIATSLIKSQPPYSTTLSRSGALTFTTPISFAGVAGSAALFSTDYYGFKAPRLYSENMTVEQQLPFSMVLGVAYAGSRGIHLSGANEGNPNTPASYTAGGLPIWITPLSTATCLVSPALTPGCRMNPAFSTNIVTGSNKDSVFHALEVSLTKRMSNGLQLQSSYTLASSIDNAQATTSDCTASEGMASDPLSTTFDRSPSCFQVRQTWVTNFLYTLPSPKIQERVLAGLTSGWGMMGILTLHTGLPFNTWETAERAQTGVFGGAANPAIDRPNWNAGRNGYNATHGGSTGCTVGASTVVPAGTPLGTPTLYYDPCAFSLQPTGQLGNEARDSMYGPGLATLDFAVQKNTKLGILGEAGSLEFRAEFFNIFNHPNFNEPNGAVLSGTVTDLTENPISTAGQITSGTSTTSRQIELALRLIF